MGHIEGSTPGSGSYVPDIISTPPESSHTEGTPTAETEQQEVQRAPAQTSSGTLHGHFNERHDVTSSSSSSSSILTPADFAQATTSSSSSSSSSITLHHVTAADSASSGLPVAVPQAKLLFDIRSSVKTLTGFICQQQSLKSDLQTKTSVLSSHLTPDQRQTVGQLADELRTLKDELQILQSNPRPAAASSESREQSLKRLDAQISGLEKLIGVQQKTCAQAQKSVIELRNKFGVMSLSGAEKLPASQQKQLLAADAQWRTQTADLRVLKERLAARVQERADVDAGNAPTHSSSTGFIDLNERRIQALKPRIAELEQRLTAIENEVKAGLGPEHAAIRNDPQSLVTLRTVLTASEDASLRETNHFEELGVQLLAFPSPAREAHIHEIASQFLRVGTWPPRGDRPFSEFRQMVIQDMLKTALSQHPPRFLGQESSGGVYEIAADVEVDGQLVRRPIGVFKPDDEAPGGAYAHIIRQEVQPGLAPETASMRQALISQLGGRNTIDSVLVQAGHQDFKYWAGDTRVPDTRDGHELEYLLLPPEVQAERNAAALGDRLHTPPLKEGIFIAYVHQAQTMKTAENYDPATVDSSVWNRVYEDVAFANWDPNDGNQMLAPSTEGILGQTTAWHQIDLDKGLPAGFISEQNAPWWGKDPSQGGQHIPPALADRIMRRDVEKEITQARDFWTKTLETRAEGIRSSDMPDEQKEQALAVLERNQWSEAQSTVLRVQDVVLRVAVQQGHTMGEIRQLSLGVQNGYDMASAEAGDLAGRFEVPEAHAQELTAELHEFAFPGIGLDIPNYISREFIRAKAIAMTHPEVVGEMDPAKRQQKIQELTMHQLAQKLRRDALWKP